MALKDDNGTENIGELLLTARPVRLKPHSHILLGRRAHRHRSAELARTRRDKDSDNVLISRACGVVFQQCVKTAGVDTSTIPAPFLSDEGLELLHVTMHSVSSAGDRSFSTQTLLQQSRALVRDAVCGLAMSC